MDAHSFHRREMTELYRAYADPIYRACMRVTHSHDDAWDLQQDILLRVLKSYGSFRGESSLQTWISSVTCNCCMDFLRLRKRKSQYVVAEDDCPYDAEPSVSCESARIHADTDLQHLLVRCHPQTRMMLRLHFFEGYSQNEVASMLGVSRISVTRRIRVFMDRAQSFSRHLDLKPE